ncbi:DEAD/DEAH box helicase [Homoserinimonas sp. OAct 916]|uniref:DEAD/DEAH box helicase n=1 Tax=Homoserinimonas sp. OAct 916 TaxID=2211450 RepID=UPI0013002369|nr:DEAD/DEAH box helicase [Homoserinimonas sp. OAct 916]
MAPSPTRLDQERAARLMPSPISTPMIARLVGPQAFTRGERYARDGHVSQLTWLKNGAQVYGTVAGSRNEPYTATVTLTTDGRGEVSRASGVCTCPLKRNCKHVAALLIVSQRSRPDSDDQTAEPVDSRHEEATESTWRKILGPLATPARAGEATPRTPLALQLDVPRKHSGHFRFVSGGPAPLPRLAARGMLAGRNGVWTPGNLTWAMLSHPPTSFDPAQVRALLALHALLPATQRFQTQADEWIYLDGIDSPALWTLLTAVVSSGVPLVSTAPGLDPVTLQAAPASVELDIRRHAGALTLAPLVNLAGGHVARRTFGFTGAPAHGVFTWDESRAADGTAGNTVRVIAPLAEAVSPHLRALTAEPVTIPPADEADFIGSFYPHLRRQFTLTSIDGSFDLPPAARPRLALTIAHHTNARIELQFEWEYTNPRAGADDTVAYRHSLWPSPGDTSFRDTEAEAEIIQSVDAALNPFPELSPPRYPRSRLADTSVLAGGRMLAFLDTAVPELEVIDRVRVTIDGNAPLYRKAHEPPLISVGTTEIAGERDWFNLAVTVSIEGVEIPFDDLFRALATGQEVMILPTGIWFDLDRPELGQLRTLIEEARGLQDVRSDSLRLSRFQADLWDELQHLGVVTEQADAWRHAMAGLTGSESVAWVPLPNSVDATLRDYQQSGFNWLAFLYEHGLGGILADDMGLGKTLQAIALIAHVQGQKDAAATDRAPFLVVAPTSVVSNWAAECARFAPDLSVATISETSKKRPNTLAEVARGMDVIITSYTLFRLDFAEYDAIGWAGLLLDEAQFVKNHKSRAHQFARRLNTPFKLAITGTPLENNLMEFWSLLSITAPGLFPTPGRFTEYYRNPIEKNFNAERLQQLRRRIRPFMLRRTKDQVATDLPEKQEQVLELELNPKHRKVYQMHLQRERQKVLGLLGDLNTNRFEIFRSLTMLRQLSLDASLYDHQYAHIPSTKLDALLEMLDDITAEGHRTLIFSQFTQYLGKARDRLDAAGITYSYLDGKTRNRARAIADFKQGDTQVFLISLKAGGFGLNLTEADYCILLDPWWNPATEAQAVDRAHRIGQTKNVMVYRLVAKDTIEEKVMALKSTKAKLFESVMTDAAHSGSGFTAADIQELLA